MAVLTFAEPLCEERKDEAREQALNEANAGLRMLLQTLCTARA